MGHKAKPTKKKDAEYKRLAAVAMSDRQAEAEVQRRWGDDGIAWHNAHARKGDLRRCQVGIRVGDVQEGWTVYGFGKTWEDAFLMAERNKR